MQPYRACTRGQNRSGARTYWSLAKFNAKHWKRYPIMKVLTVRQPWAYAIIHLGKDVENRKWRSDYSEPLLIHAGLHRESNYHEMLLEYLSRPPSEENLQKIPHGCIVGVVELKRIVKGSKSKWAAKGKRFWHWELSKPRPIRPVKCTGRLGLWTPPAAIVKQFPQWLKMLDRK